MEETVSKHTFVKLKRLPGAVSGIGSQNAAANGTKIGEIFQTAPDHLAFVCVHCAAELPLFIQFAAHIAEHLQHINTNSIESTPKKFLADNCITPALKQLSMDDDSHHMVIEPVINIKYELTSDEETENVGDDDERPFVETNEFGN